jgi:hypothetical protein
VIAALPAVIGPALGDSTWAQRAQWQHVSQGPCPAPSLCVYVCVCVRVCV